MFAVNLRPDGRTKDTLVNIERTGEFVVNIADEALALAMHETSGDFPPEIGEPNYLGLKLAPSSKIATPRLADTPWAMECKTWKTIDVNGDRRLIMGEGINFYIRDELWDRDAMRVHMERYHPIGRMFADRYCRTDDRVTFPAAEGARGESVAPSSVVPANAGTHTGDLRPCWRLTQAVSAVWCWRRSGRSPAARQHSRRSRI